LEEQKFQNEESIKRTLKMMKNRNFTEDPSEKAKAKKEKQDTKEKDKAEEADDENMEEEGMLLFYLGSGFILLFTL
jgi:ribosomal protein S21